MLQAWLFPPGVFICVVHVSQASLLVTIASAALATCDDEKLTAPGDSIVVYGIVQPRDLLRLHLETGLGKLGHVNPWLHEEVRESVQVAPERKQALREKVVLPIGALVA